jgi:hypothetical protein
MLITRTIRRSIHCLCCAIGIATLSAPSALAVTAHDALCIAELITAGCRATALVAQHIEASGDKNANTAHTIAYAAQAANELLALINHWDDPVRALGYSGSWLVYDLYQLADRLSAVDPEVKAPAAADGGKQGADAATVPTPKSGPAAAVEPLIDGSFEQIADLLQRDLLPAIETIAAIASAAIGWQETAEQPVGRNRLQSLLSLSRIIRLCLERRNEPDMQYYAAVATAHVLLTIAEFTPLLNAQTDKHPATLVAELTVHIRQLEDQARQELAQSRQLEGPMRQHVAQAQQELDQDRQIDEQVRHCLAQTELVVARADQARAQVRQLEEQVRQIFAQRNQLITQQNQHQNRARQEIALADQLVAQSELYIGRTEGLIAQRDQLRAQLTQAHAQLRTLNNAGRRGPATNTLT